MAPKAVVTAGQRKVYLSDSDSDSDDDGYGGDIARRIASRVAAARLRRSFGGGFLSHSGGSAAVSRIRGATQRHGRDRGDDGHGDDDVRVTETSAVLVAGNRPRAAPTLVDSASNTCDRTVTIDKHVFNSLQQEKRRADDTAESAGSAESVFLNVLVDASAAAAPAADPRVENLEVENARLRASLAAHEQKASLLKNDRLLMSKQFQMIQCEREEMGAFARAMTARRECMAARIVSIGKERETLRRQLSEERVAAAVMRAKLVALESKAGVEADKPVADVDGASETLHEEASTYVDDDDNDDGGHEDDATLVDDDDAGHLRGLLIDRRVRYKKLVEANALLSSSLGEITARVQSERVDSVIKVRSVEAECSRLREELAVMTRRADTNEALVAEAFASVTAAIDEAKTIKDAERLPSAQKPSTPNAKLTSDGGTDPKTPVSTRCAETTTHDGFATKEGAGDEVALRKRQIMLLASPLMADAGRHDFSAADPYGLGEASYEYKTSSEFEEDRKRWLEVMGQEGFASPGTARLGEELLKEEHYFESLAFEKSMQQQEEEERLRAQVDALQERVQALEASRNTLLAEKEANAILFLGDEFLEETLIDDLEEEECGDVDAEQCIMDDHAPPPLLLDENAGAIPAELRASSLGSSKRKSAGHDTGVERAPLSSLSLNRSAAPAAN